MKTVWIIGAGQFGEKAAVRLRLKYPEAAIIVVDQDRNALTVSRGWRPPSWSEDGVVYLAEHLTVSEEPDWIVAAVPVHVAFEWLCKRLSPAYRIGKTDGSGSPDAKAWMCLQRGGRQGLHQPGRLHLPEQLPGTRRSLFRHRQTAADRPLPGTVGSGPPPNDPGDRPQSPIVTGCRRLQARRYFRRPPESRSLPRTGTARHGLSVSQCAGCLQTDPTNILKQTVSLAFALKIFRCGGPFLLAIQTGIGYLVSIHGFTILSYFPLPPGWRNR